jgi:hypothetical protein
MGRQLEHRAAFDLIPSIDFQSIVENYDARRRGTDRKPPGLVMDQAIALVATAAAIFNEGRWHQLPHPLVPCWDIAEAWAVLIKHTIVYRALSETLGVFVDWLPHPDALQADVEVTMAAVEVANYVVHTEIWTTDEPSDARAGVVGL